MDYKKAYYCLFNAIIDSMNILQQAQGKTEEMYLEEGDGEEDHGEDGTGERGA